MRQCDYRLFVNGVQSSAKSLPAAFKTAEKKMHRLWNERGHSVELFAVVRCFSSRQSWFCWLDTQFDFHYRLI